MDMLHPGEGERERRLDRSNRYPAGIPQRGLEAVGVTTSIENGLEKSTPRGAAISGAVAAESRSVPLTVEALAAALLALSPSDRARLAALLIGKPIEQSKGTTPSGLFRPPNTEPTDRWPDKLTAWSPGEPVFSAQFRQSE